MNLIGVVVSLVIIDGWSMPAPKDLWEHNVFDGSQPLLYADNPKSQEVICLRSRIQYWTGKAAFTCNSLLFDFTDRKAKQLDRDLRRLLGEVR